MQGAPLPSDNRQKLRQLMWAYSAFQMATALVVTESHIPMSDTIIVLLAVSIPTTAAYGGIGKVSPTEINRYPEFVRLFSFYLFSIFSVAAISLIFAAESTFGAIAFPITCVTWYLVVVLVRKPSVNHKSGTENSTKD